MSQKWSRLKCISLLSTVSSLFYLGLFGSATYAKSEILPNLLKEVEKKYSHSPTLVADFSQINQNVTLSQKKQSSGRIFIKRPSKIRWETQKPDVNLMLSDGKHFWFYTPPFVEGENGQVIEKKASEVQTAVATALIAGNFSASKMSVRQKNPSTFILIPKPGTAGSVSEAVVEIDPVKKLIQKVVLTHQGGNHTEILLSKIELGNPLKDSLFTFHAPPNTEVVKENLSHDL